MNNKPNKKNQIDETAQRLFENFQVPPPSGLWDDIEAVSPDDKIDKVFERQFKYLEVTPPNRNWLAIRKRIIFPPIILRHLSTFSKIAAILVIGLLCYHSFYYIQHQNYIVQHQIEKPKPKTSITFGEAIQKKKALKQEVLPDLTIPPQFISKEEQKKEEARNLLASLLADNEFPDSLLDLESIEAILEPLEPLPVFSAMASAAENEKIIMEALSVERVKYLPTLPTTDLTISIPLRVVEEHEIEHLLKMYETFEKEKEALLQ